MFAFCSPTKIGEVFIILTQTHHIAGTAASV